MANVVRSEAAHLRYRLAVRAHGPCDRTETRARLRRSRVATDRPCRRMAHHRRRADVIIESRREPRNNRCADRAGQNASRPETNSQDSARQKQTKSLLRKSASYGLSRDSLETVERFSTSRHDRRGRGARARAYHISSSTSETAFCKGRGPFPFSARSTSSRRRIRSRTSRRSTGPPAAAQK